MALPSQSQKLDHLTNSEMQKALGPLKTNFCTPEHGPSQYVENESYFKPPYIPTQELHEYFAEYDRNLNNRNCLLSQLDGASSRIQNTQKFGGGQQQSQNNQTQNSIFKNKDHIITYKGGKHNPTINEPPKSVMPWNVLVS